MQSLVIKKTLESILLDHRRGEESIQEQSFEFEKNAEKQSSNEEKVNQAEPGDTEVSI